MSEENGRCRNQKRDTVCDEEDKVKHFILSLSRCPPQWIKRGILFFTLSSNLLTAGLC